MAGTLAIERPKKRRTLRELVVDNFAGGGGVKVVASMKQSGFVLITCARTGAGSKREASKHRKAKRAGRIAKRKLLQELGEEE